MRYFLHLLIFVIIIQDAAFADSPGHTESNAPREHDPNMKRTEKLKKAKVVILCPPFDSSPCFALRTIGEELVARGHDVKLLTTGIVISSSASSVETIVYNPPFTVNVKKMMLDGLGSAMKTFRGLLTFLEDALNQEKICLQYLIDNEVTSTALKNADIIFLENSFLGGSLITEYFKKPRIVLNTVLFSVIAKTFKVPMPSSYVPIFFNKGASDQMTFFQRVANTLAWNVLDVIFKRGVDFGYRDLRKQYNIAPGKSCEELVGMAEIVLEARDFALEFVHPLMPSRLKVGFLTIIRKITKSHPKGDDDIEFSIG